MHSLVTAINGNQRMGTVILYRVCFFCRLAKQHKFQSFAVKNAVSFQKCRFDVFTEVTKLAVCKSRRLVGESRRLVGKSRRFNTLTYHRKHVNAKSASVQNSWRLLEKAVLIEKALKMHTYEGPGISILFYVYNSFL